MQKQFTTSIKVYLLLFTFATIIWMGSGTTRAFIANEFFYPTTLQYRPDITYEVERSLFQLVSATSAVTLIAYMFVVFSALMLLIKLPLKCKEHGWLLASSILLFLFVPVEVFTGYLDIKFILLWENTKSILQIQGLDAYPAYSTLLRETLSHRIGALSGLPVMALLCYYSAIVLIVWQPMKRIFPVETGSEGNGN